MFYGAEERGEWRGAHDEAPWFDDEEEDETVFQAVRVVVQSGRTTPSLVSFSDARLSPVREDDDSEEQYEDSDEKYDCPPLNIRTDVRTTERAAHLPPANPTNEYDLFPRSLNAPRTATNEPQHPSHGDDAHIPHPTLVPANSLRLPPGNSLPPSSYLHASSSPSSSPPYHLLSIGQDVSPSSLRDGASLALLAVARWMECALEGERR